MNGFVFPLLCISGGSERTNVEYGEIYFTRNQIEADANAIYFGRRHFMRKGLGHFGLLVLWIFVILAIFSSSLLSLSHSLSRFISIKLKTHSKILLRAQIHFVCSLFFSRGVSVS